MPISSDSLTEPLVPPTNSLSSSISSLIPQGSTAPQNIQFFIESAKGLPLPPVADIRSRCIVSAPCSSKRGRKRKNYRTSASPSYRWYDNTSQIGPIFGTDQITFSVELHTPLRMVKGFVNTVASSAPYTINKLLEMQAKTKDYYISIPLRVNKKQVNQDAFLLLRVKQPTATFISQRLQEEVERLFTERERKEKEGRLTRSSSTRTSVSESSPALRLDAGYTID